MRVNSSRTTVAALALEARAEGLTVTDVAGTCSTPVEMQLFGYPDKVLVGFGIEPERSVTQLLKARCRKCPECLEHRRRLWTARAIAETTASSRTWFGTLTLAPDRAIWARYSALKRLEDRQSDIDEDAVFRGMVRCIGPELANFFKRLRKKASLRYLLVTEKHQSGTPHWHLLIHENGTAITKRVLEDRWSFGFSNWRLVPTLSERECGYVCKYLAKDALTRVKASQAYGSPVRSLTERLEATRELVLSAGREHNDNTRKTTTPDDDEKKSE